MLNSVLVPCPREVSNRAFLSPQLFLLYINDIDSIAEGVEGAITDSGTIRVTYMLHAFDLCLTANRPDQLQTMLNRLDEYAKRKGLIINTGKSEVVHFDSHSFNIPAFSVGGPGCSACLQGFIGNPGLGTRKTRRPSVTYPNFWWGTLQMPKLKQNQKAPTPMHPAQLNST